MMIISKRKNLCKNYIFYVIILIDYIRFFKLFLDVEIYRK